VPQIYQESPRTKGKENAMSKHGEKMSDAFQRAETARRERLGKAVEAPKSEVKKAPTVQPFNISYGERA
jgi:hypothetical protein